MVSSYKKDTVYRIVDPIHIMNNHFLGLPCRLMRMDLRLMGSGTRHFSQNPTPGVLSPTFGVLSPTFGVLSPTFPYCTTKGNDVLICFDKPSF